MGSLDKNIPCMNPSKEDSERLSTTLQGKGRRNGNLVLQQYHPCIPNAFLVLSQRHGRRGAARNNSAGGHGGRIDCVARRRGRTKPQWRVSRSIQGRGPALREGRGQAPMVHPEIWPAGGSRRQQAVAGGSRRQQAAIGGGSTRQITL